VLTHQLACGFLTHQMCIYDVRSEVTRVLGLCLLQRQSCCLLAMWLVCTIASIDANLFFEHML